MPNGNAYNVNNGKCTEWPQTDRKHLTVKCIFYSMNACPQIPNFHPFRVTTAVGNRKCTEWHQNDLEYLTVKSTLYTLNWILPQTPKLRSFYSMTSRLQGSRLSKIGNAPNDPGWAWTRKYQKYPVYIKYLLLRPNFHSVSLHFKMPKSNFCEYCHREHLDKLWLWRSSVLKFSSRYGPLHRNIYNYISIF